MKAAGTILKMSAPGYIDHLPEPLRPGAIETLETIHAHAVTFNDETAQIPAEHRDAVGRAMRQREVAESAGGKLDAVWRTVVQPLADRKVGIVNLFLTRPVVAPPTDPGARLAHELHLQEIRNQLRELSPADRLHVYQTTSDPLTITAIETAPIGVLGPPRPDGSRRVEPFVDPEKRIEVILARAAVSDPETMTTLREVESLIEIYTLAIGSVRKEITDVVSGV